MTNGIIGMLVAACATILMLMTCASETKEKFDRALATEIDDTEV